MKKIMFLLAFVSIGIFAGASNGKVSSFKKTPHSLVIEQLKPNYYVVVYHCWSGDLTVGSFSTYAQASAYMNSHSVNAICP